MKRIAAAIILLCFGFAVGFASDPSGSDGEYNPQIIPEDFSTVIDNSYFPLIPGTVTVYEGDTDEGTEVIIVEVTHETREVMGILCLVVRDRVWANGELVEDTDDWYAQDSNGNVWYMGEISKEYEDGVIVSYEGSWEAGVDGAIPGIIIHGSPTVGIPYYQEYWEGVAEDMAEVVSLNETVVTSYGTFDNCLQLKEWNPLEWGSREYKYFSPGIGFIMEEQGREQIILVDTIPESEVEAYIEEIESRDYSVPIGLEVFIGTGIEEINTGERAFYAAPGIFWEVFETGLSLTVELFVPIVPEFEIESLTVIEEYEYEFEDIYLIIYAGNENSIVLGELGESEGLANLVVTFLEIFSLELNFTYLPDIELGSIVSAGYEFELGKRSLLEIGAAINFLFYDEPGVSDAEFEIVYTLAIGSLNLALGVEPVIEIEKIDDNYESDFLISPYFVCTYSF